MLKLLSIRNVIIFCISLFVTSVVIASTFTSKKQIEKTSGTNKLIVVNKDENKKINNVSITNSSYNEESGFKKDYEMLDKQMINQNKISEKHHSLTGKVYIPKSFEEASRLAELKHGIKRQKNNIINKNNVSKSVNLPEDNKGISFLASVIYHSNGKSDLSQADLKSLEEVAKFVKSKSARVLVVGHSSSRTLDMSMLKHKMVNYDVSVRRANRIKSELIKNGLSSDIISLSAVSDTEPIKNEIMPQSESVNRRSEIYISY